MLDEDQTLWYCDKISNSQSDQDNNKEIKMSRGRSDSWTDLKVQAKSKCLAGKVRILNEEFLTEALRRSRAFSDLSIIVYMYLDRHS